LIPELAGDMKRKKMILKGPGYKALQKSYYLGKGIEDGGRI